MKHRLFLGIPVSDELKRSITTLLPERSRRLFPPNTRWVPPENYHVTISFFGYVADKELANVEAKIETILQKINPFSLELENISLAPPKKKPTMLWAIFKQNVAFTELVRSIEEGIGNKAVANDFRKSHAPIPHITLARFKGVEAFDIARLSAGKAQAKSLKLEVSTCYLFESKLRPNGPIYTPLHQFSLNPNS
jgi:RNA 2',3'-cyclic 3'-phosphodiesterase